MRVLSARHGTTVVASALARVAAEMRPALPAGDPVATAVLQLLSAQIDDVPWQGTATALLSELDRVAPAHLRVSSLWPLKPNALGNAIDRATPILLSQGVQVAKRATGRQRLITLARIPQSQEPIGPAGRKP